MTTDNPKHPTSAADEAMRRATDEAVDAGNRADPGHSTAPLSVEDRLAELERDVAVLETMVRIAHTAIGGVGIGFVEALSDADAATIAKIRAAAAGVRSMRPGGDDAVARDVAAGWREAANILENIAQNHEIGRREERSMAPTTETHQ